MIRILITGSDSYIGTSLERHLACWPAQYRVDTLNMRSSTWREHNFSGYDSVFHVAGIAHQDSGRVTDEQIEQYYRVNTDLALQTAQKAKAEGVGQFIFMSSMIIYGKSAPVGKVKVIKANTVPAPAGAYGDSKWQADRAIRALGEEEFRVAVLRPPMIYGPGCKGNYIALEKAAKKLPFFPEIRNQRSMLHIDGLCDCVKKCIDARAWGIFYPQDKEYVCTSDMVRNLAIKQGKSLRMTRFFNPFLRLMAGRWDLVNKVFGGLVYDKTLPGCPLSNGHKDEHDGYFKK